MPIIPLTRSISHRIIFKEIVLHHAFLFGILNSMKITLLCLTCLFLSSAVKAEVLFKDVGIIGLMSHDIFAWDRVNEVNTENGRLDLSTIFDYDNGTRWEKGGNPKNAENSPVYTITKMLVSFYKKELKQQSPVIARQKTVSLFHSMIKDSFSRITGLEFPVQGLDRSVTNTEQAALRAMHDILPGRAKLYGRLLMKDFEVTNFLFAKLILNEKELNQVLPYFNGDYADEYKHIKIPFTSKFVNLKEVDGKFIEKFSPYRQADMLEELARVGRGELLISEVSFIQHIQELVAKAICPRGNSWMPQDISCNP